MDAPCLNSKCRHPWDGSEILGWREVEASLHGLLLGDERDIEGKWAGWTAHNRKLKEKMKEKDFDVCCSRCGKIQREAREAKRPKRTEQPMQCHLITTNSHMRAIN